MDRSPRFFGIYALGAALIAGCASTPRGDCGPARWTGEIGSICGVANPEDIEVVSEAGIALVSEMRFPAHTGGGSIAAIALDEVEAGTASPRRLWPPESADRQPPAELVGDPSCTKPAADFSPHGLFSAGAAGARRVAVVNHGEVESVELFDLVGSGKNAQLRWRGCVPLPPDTSANDVAIAPDGEIVVSNFMPDPPTKPSLRGLWSMFTASTFGWATGDVMAWTKEHGWRHVRGTEATAPNGVAVSADGESIYYAETFGSRVVRVPRAGRGEGPPQAVEIPGGPDNLSWTSRGTLLVATHMSTTALTFCMLGKTPCRSSWAVYEIDPTSLSAKEILRHDGEVVGAVATAAESGKLHFLGAVYDDRIGVWRP